MSSNTSSGLGVPAASDQDIVLYNPVALPDPLLYMYVIYLVLIIVIGVPGNIIIALVYGRTKTKNTCDWFILFMSVTDCTVCLVSPLLHLRHELHFSLPFMSGALCGMEHWIQLTAMLCSCHYLTAIAIDRYVKICNSRLPTLKPKFAPYACVASFVSSAIICIYPSLTSFSNEQCGLFDPRAFSMSRKIYFTIIFCGFVVSFISVSYAYWNVCKQIFIKVQNKQRLLENNGLHAVTENAKAEISVKTQQVELEMNRRKRFSSRLLSLKCVQTVFCCSRHEPGSYDKSLVLSESKEGKSVSEHMRLTSNQNLRASDISLNLESASTANGLIKSPKSDGVSDGKFYIYDGIDVNNKNNVNVPSDACDKQGGPYLEKGINGAPRVTTDILKSGQRSSLDVGYTRKTLLSLTTASWPSTEEEPTPSADIPVSFYLENLSSQEQNDHLKVKDADPSEQQSDFKSSGQGFNENINGTSARDASPNDLTARSCGVGECVTTNVYVNKLSLLEDKKPYSIASTEGLKTALLNGSLIEDSEWPVQAFPLKNSISQPLLCSLESKNKKFSEPSSVLLKEAGPSPFRPCGSNLAADRQVDTHKKITRSVTVDADSSLFKRLDPHRTADCDKTNPVSPLLADVIEIGSSGNHLHGPPGGDCTDLKIIENATMDCNKQQGAPQTSTVMNKSSTVSKTVDKLNPDNIIDSAPSVTPSHQNSQNTLFVQNKANYRSDKSLCHIPTPSRSIKSFRAKTSCGSRDAKPLRSPHRSLRAMNSQSVDSDNGGYIKEDYEIEEDLPTGSFMRKWRSQMRHKDRCRRNKGLTSSGKSMCGITGKRFAKERQITTLVTFVSASFVLLWMPAWTYYLICFYAPHVLASRNVRSLFAIGCRVYLLNFVINAILFYRYNPRYREAACSCFRGCFREAESASSPTAKTCQIHVTAASEERIP